MLNSEQLDRCKKSISDYCYREFEHDADFSDLENIGLAYTNLTDKEIPIQVSLDLVNLKLKTFIGDDNCGPDSLVSVDDISYEDILFGFDFGELTEGWTEYIERECLGA